MLSKSGVCGLLAYELSKTESLVRYYLTSQVIVYSKELKKKNFNTYDPDIGEIIIKILYLWFLLTCRSCHSSVSTLLFRKTVSAGVDTCVFVLSVSSDCWLLSLHAIALSALFFINFSLSSVSNWPFCNKIKKKKNLLKLLFLHNDLANLKIVCLTWSLYPQKLVRCRFLISLVCQIILINVGH